MAKIMGGGGNFSNNGTTTQKSVAVVFIKRFIYNLNFKKTDPNGRYIRCEIKIDTNRITTVYVPNLPSNRKRVLEELSIDNEYIF